MASPVAQPGQPAAQPDLAAPPDAAVSHDQLAQAINNGTSLAAQTENSEDFLRFAQGVQMLANSLVQLHQAENPPPAPPQSGTPRPGGNAQTPSGAQG